MLVVNTVNQKSYESFRTFVGITPIFHNVYSITRILHELAEEGFDVDVEAAAMLSPYITGHINRFGKYTLNLDRGIPSPDYNMTIRSNGLPQNIAY
jgi:hypothetical protein